jgi:flagellar motor switch protein FliN/FliY
MQWELGSVVMFEKIVGSPIDVLIGDRLIARGEVVVVNDSYGVRINEITHPDEKPV